MLHQMEKSILTTFSFGMPKVWQKIEPFFFLGYKVANKLLFSKERERALDLKKKIQTGRKIFLTTQIF